MGFMLRSCGLSSRTTPKVLVGAASAASSCPGSLPCLRRGGSQGWRLIRFLRPCFFSSNRRFPQSAPVTPTLSPPRHTLTPTPPPPAFSPPPAHPQPDPGPTAYLHLFPTLPRPQPRFPLHT